MDEDPKKFAAKLESVCRDVQLGASKSKNCIFVADKFFNRIKKFVRSCMTQ